MKKYLAAGAAVGAAAALAVGAREVRADGECKPPVSQFESEMQGAVDALEHYLAVELAPLYNKPATLDWYVDAAPIIKPGSVRLLLVLGEDGGFGVSRSYNITLERECAGGDWKVGEVIRRGDPEPKAQLPD